MGVWQWSSTSGAADTQPTLTIPGKFADGLEFIQMNVDFTVAMGYEDPETGRVYTSFAPIRYSLLWQPPGDHLPIGCTIPKVHNRTNTSALLPGEAIP